MERVPMKGRMYHGSETDRSVNQRTPPDSREGTGRSDMARRMRNMPKPMGIWTKLMNGMNFFTLYWLSMFFMASFAACTPTRSLAIVAVLSASVMRSYIGSFTRRRFRRVECSWPKRTGLQRAARKKRVVARMLPHQGRPV